MNRSLRWALMKSGRHKGLTIYIWISSCQRRCGCLRSPDHMSANMKSLTRDKSYDVDSRQEKLFHHSNQTCQIPGSPGVGVLGARHQMEKRASNDLDVLVDPVWCRTTSTSSYRSDDLQAALLLDLISHLSFNPCHSACTAIHHRCVDLAQACPCVECLETLLTICDATRGKYDLRWS